MLFGKFLFILSNPNIADPFSEIKGKFKSSFLLKSSISTSVLLVLGIMIIPSLTRLFI